MGVRHVWSEGEREPQRSTLTTACMKSSTRLWVLSPLLAGVERTYARRHHDRLMHRERNRRKTLTPRMKHGTNHSYFCFVLATYVYIHVKLRCFRSTQTAASCGPHHMHALWPPSRLCSRLGPRTRHLRVLPGRRYRATRSCN